MPTYTVRIENPIISKEVMKVETEERGLAMMEAEHYSRRHGVARVYDNSSGAEIARFRYGVDELSEARPAPNQSRGGES